MGSDRAKLLTRCCLAAVSIVVISAMFWIAWCVFGVTAVPMSESQRRAIVHYSPTPSVPVTADETSASNAISKLSTTSSLGKELAAKGDFATRENKAANLSVGTGGSKPVRNPTPEPKKGPSTVEPRDVPARRVVSSAVEANPDIAPTRTLLEASSKIQAYASQDESKSEDVQSSRRADDDPVDRVPEFVKGETRRRVEVPPADRRRQDEDERGSKGKYGVADRGRESDERYSKGDTRVFPDDADDVRFREMGKGDRVRKGDEDEDDRYRYRYRDQRPRPADDERYRTRNEERYRYRDGERYRDRDGDELRDRDDDKFRDRDGDKLRDRDDDKVRDRGIDRYRDRDDETFRKGDEDKLRDRDDDKVRDRGIDRYRDRDDDTFRKGDEDKLRDRVDDKIRDRGIDRYRDRDTDRYRDRDIDRYRDRDDDTFRKGDEDKLRDRNVDRYRDRDDDKSRDRDIDRYRDRDDYKLRDRDVDKYRDRDGYKVRDREGDDKLRVRDVDSYRDMDDDRLRERGGDKYLDRDVDRLRDRDGDRYKDREGDVYKVRDVEKYEDRDRDRYRDRDDDRYRDRDRDRYIDRDDDRYRDRDKDRYRDDERYRPRVDDRYKEDKDEDRPIYRDEDRSSMGDDAKYRPRSGDDKYGYRGNERYGPRNDEYAEQRYPPREDDRLRPRERSRDDDNDRRRPSEGKGGYRPQEDDDKYLPTSVSAPSKSASSRYESSLRSDETVTDYDIPVRPPRPAYDEVGRPGKDRLEISPTRPRGESSDSRSRGSEDDDWKYVYSPRSRLRDDDRVVVQGSRRSSSADGASRRYADEMETYRPVESTRSQDRKEDVVLDRRSYASDDEYRRSSTRDDDRRRTGDSRRRYEDEDGYSRRDRVDEYDEYRRDRDRRRDRYDEEDSRRYDRRPPPRYRDEDTDRGVRIEGSRREEESPRPRDEDRSYDRSDYGPYDSRDSSETSRKPASSREHYLGSSMVLKDPDDSVAREKRYQGERPRDVSEAPTRSPVRPLSAKDVIEAANRQSDTSESNARKVFYPVFDPRLSNITSPDVIQPSERRGTTITLRKRRSVRFK